MADLSAIDRFYDNVVKGLPYEDLERLERAPASEGIKDPNSVLRPLGAQMVQKEPTTNADLGIINPSPASGYTENAENYRRNIESNVRGQESDLSDYLARSKNASGRADSSRRKAEESLNAINSINPTYKEDPSLNKSISDAKAKALSDNETPERDMWSELILSFGPAALGAVTGEAGAQAAPVAQKQARDLYEGQRKERSERVKAAKESAMKVYDVLSKIKQSSRESWDKEQQRTLDRAKAIKDANIDMYKVDAAQADKYLSEASKLSQDISKSISDGSKTYADLSNKVIDEANKEVRAKILAGQAQTKLSLEERKQLETERANRADESLKSRKVRADEAKAARQGENLALEEKKTVENLATKNANKVGIKNQIDAVLSSWDSYSDDQKLAQGRQLLKTLNSPEGADAIGAEEASRLGSKLEFAMGNFTNSNPTQFGRDLKGFKQQAQDTSTNLGKAIDSNRSIITGIMEGRGIPSQGAQAPAAAKEMSREEKIKLLKSKGYK